MSGVGASAPAAGWYGGFVGAACGGQAQGAVAVSASRNGDAVSAGQDWYVSFAWYLDEYGFVGVEGASHGLEGYFRQACGAGVGVAFQGGVGVGDGVDAGHAHADGVAGSN